jgi:hypothetical protein
LSIQVIVGIGARPVIGPFEAVGVNTKVGGIEVCFQLLMIKLMNLVLFSY